MLFITGFALINETVLREGLTNGGVFYKMFETYARRFREIVPEGIWNRKVSGSCPLEREW
jgi:hypothetical protein